MSHLDPVDYDYARHEKRQTTANERFKAFTKEADEIITNCVRELGRLKGEYEEFLKYDDLDDYVVETIADEFNLNLKGKR